MTFANTVALSSILVLAAAPAISQDAKLQTAAPAAATSAAAQSLDTFRSISNAPTQFKTLGLDAPGDASHASIGDPVADYMIGLDPLREWDGGDPMKLLRPTGQFVYSITVDGKTKSSVTIAEIKGEWVAAAFGTPNEARARSDIKANSTAQAPGGTNHFAQVRVPALRTTFVALQANDGLVLTSLTSRPEFGLEPGKWESASTVLRRLQPFARRIDPNLPN
ncbi:hypothetical protein CO683_23730 [Bradyrhizobium ottawaense]|uniref:Uncharacterized protein n=1 Tax=Bradyrhizobium ottawaense TaxID=931866 RepID=A0A2U8P8F0_9BRAD|nr:MULTISPECIES: hypothetical protein [Bradyrhizobium]AWL94013.1 hypothetical protein CIT37_19020 [Bradyrhizobium ottawaense]MBR1328715.1 hypothetical protein [Bradyrhizobium ottawaense]MBR1334463.1 hypothetical protein [Bradyrhizobium ottawaense]MDA9415288.1 hypothetical protein [Bradyrhizobium sp. CCBAU 25360]MDA9483493.1 hypothetical protein [Bradyrhizobium sp. CCBAU 11445]